MIVVSDTSPLIALAVVQQLDLLRLLYTQVLIPEAVYQEATSITNAPGSGEIDQAEWIQVYPVLDRKLVGTLSAELDLGEAEAIALAIEQHADLLLIDERRGRAVAERLGHRVVGVLGTLIEAKQRGILPLVRPVLDALAMIAGFHFTAALYSRILTAAGE